MMCTQPTVFNRLLKLFSMNVGAVGWALNNDARVSVGWTSQVLLNKPECLMKSNTFCEAGRSNNMGLPPIEPGKDMRLMTWRYEGNRSMGHTKTMAD